ncbi:MAG: PQQ-binding-like beta-propeller repeat protein [Planctomycetota bacterium]
MSHQSSVVRESLTLFVLGLGSLCASAADRQTGDDWTMWRGQSGDGQANADSSVPVSWDAETNIAWRAFVPGKGHGSVTVLNDQVFLATAESSSETQSVICLSRGDGKQRWKTTVHQGGFKNKSKRKPNPKSSLASSTIATDGTMLFVNFLNDNAVITSALTLHGEIVWQKTVSPYLIHQGYGSSPTIYKNLVIVTADNRGGGAVVAFDRKSGDEVWRQERPKKPNYASPIVLHVDGRDQLVLTGCDLVASLNPINGEIIWQTQGATTECVTTSVTDGDRVFTSGGYPRNHISAIVADGSGEVAWETNLRVYVPSLLCRDGHLYATLDEGIAVCLESDTGKTKWKARLGGTFSASPLLVGDLIYAMNESGETSVFEANSRGFRLIGKNQLGDHAMATPVVCGGQLFIRAASYEGDERKEYVYCIKQPSS